MNGISDNFNSQSALQLSAVGIEDIETLTQFAPIVLIDDEPQIMRLYEVMLARVGLRTVSLPDSDTALDYCVQKPVSLVISELLRPHINGLTMLELLRRDPSTTDVPFIMITATPEYDSRTLFESLGGNAFLTKPINIRQLTHVVNNLLDEQLARCPVH